MISTQKPLKCCLSWLKVQNINLYLFCTRISDGINSYQIPVKANDSVTATQSHSSGNWGSIDFTNYSSSLFSHQRPEEAAGGSCQSHVSSMRGERGGGFSFLHLSFFSSLSLLLIFYSLHAPPRLTRLLIKPAPQTPHPPAPAGTGIKLPPPYCLPYFTLFPRSYHSVTIKSFFFFSKGRNQFHARPS